jgi:hypothetical protein
MTVLGHTDPPYEKPAIHFTFCMCGNRRWTQCWHWICLHMHCSAPVRKPQRYLCVRQHIQCLPSVSGHYKVLGVFAELRKVTTSFVVSVRMEKLGCDWIDFYEILYLRIFRKSVEKMRVSVESVMFNGCYVVCTFMIICRGILLRLRNAVLKIRSHV